MKRKKLVCFIKFICILLALLSLGSCDSEKSAEEILFSITQGQDSLPNGTVYTRSAPEGSQNYLSGSMIKTLYHESAEEYEFTLIEDFAIYLSSFAKPCEIAVYKCYSRSDTDLIASMCLKRIEKLRIMLAQTAFCEIPENAKIDIKGRFVIVTML